MRKKCHGLCGVVFVDADNVNTTAGSYLRAKIMFWISSDSVYGHNRFHNDSHKEAVNHAYDA